MIAYIVLRCFGFSSHLAKEENGNKGDDKGKGKGGKGKGGGDPGEKPDGCKSLMVRNLKTSVDEDALWEFFSEMPSCTKVKLVTDRETGESRGFAFVDFDDDDDVDKAIKLHNTEVHGQAVSLKYNVPLGLSGGRAGGDRF